MSSMLAINEDSIKYAMEKFQNFITLNRSGERENKLDALEMFCESLGVTDEVSDQMFEAIGEQFSEEYASQLFVGSLIGLAIAEHATEQND